MHLIRAGEDDLLDALDEVARLQTEQRETQKGRDDLAMQVGELRAVVRQLREEIETGVRKPRDTWQKTTCSCMGRLFAE